jgi:PAS domain S-box-containing protein
MRILVADDDLICRRRFQAMLTSWGHEVVIASNGLEAWDALRSEKAPRLALLDWMMPELDGVDVVRRVRESPQHSTPYVILLSARGSQEDVVRGLDAGANDYLKKPVSPPELRARIQVGARVLELQQHLAERVSQLEVALGERERAQAESLRLAAAVTQATEAIVITDARGTIQYVNPAFTAITGYSAPEALGRNPSLLKSGRHDLKYYESLWKTILVGQTWQGEVVNRRKDGTLYTEQMSITPVRNGTGAITNFIAIKEDVTKRGAAQEELAREQNLLGTLMDNLPDQIYFKDSSSRFIRVNREQAKRLGLARPEQAIGKTDHDFFAAEHASEAYEDERQIMETGNPLVAKDEKETWPDGRVTWVTSTKMPLRGPSGEIIGTFGLSRDITARKQAEEANALLASIVECSDDAIFGIVDGIIVSWNRAAETIYGYRAEEVQGHHVSLLAPPERQNEVLQLLERTKRGEKVRNFETVRMRKDRSRIDMSLTISPIKNAAGEVTGASAIGRDISERKRAEEALAAEHNLLRTLIDSLPDSIFVKDRNSRFQLANTALARALGVERPEQMTWKSDFDFLPASLAAQYVADDRAVMESGQALMSREEPSVDRGSGRERWLSTSKIPLRDNQGEIAGVVGICRDITERRQLELELRQAQKLEAVGGLAAGIAHEINTPIQFVGDNTRFLQDAFASLQTLLKKYQEWGEAASTQTVDPHLLEEVKEAVETADLDYLTEEIPKALSQSLEGVGRVATIVRAMKEFAHPDRKEKAAADLNKALHSTLIVARNELKYVADVETDLGELPPVVCHLGDINQVFLNLLVNAAHAIKEVVKESGEKGKILVQTRREGEMVRIAITDTGCGIPESIRTKIFEPFFTTKEVGQGTGQGLAIARSIVVEKHGGTLTFRTELGRGTTFEICLPISQVSAPREAIQQVGS